MKPLFGEIEQTIRVENPICWKLLSAHSKRFDLACFVSYVKLPDEKNVW